MSVNRIDGLPLPGNSPSGDTDGKTQKKTGTDGIRLIEPSDNHKLLPLPKAIHSEQTPLNKRQVRSLVAAWNKSVEQKDMKALLEWFNQHKVREVSPQNLISSEGDRTRGTPLRERNVQQVHGEKINQVAMQLIQYHLRPQSNKDASGTSTASARINPALVNRSRRKANKKGGDGDSNFISDSADTGSQTVERKEIEEGMDSVRENPNSST